MLIFCVQSDAASTAYDDFVARESSDGWGWVERPYSEIRAHLVEICGKYVSDKVSEYEKLKGERGELFIARHEAWMTIQRLREQREGAAAIGKWQRYLKHLDEEILKTKNSIAEIEAELKQVGPIKHLDGGFCRTFLEEYNALYYREQREKEHGGYYSPDPAKKPEKPLETPDPPSDEDDYRIMTPGPSEDEVPLGISRRRVESGASGKVARWAENARRSLDIPPPSSRTKRHVIDATLSPPSVSLPPRVIVQRLDDELQGAVTTHFNERYLAPPPQRMGSLPSRAAASAAPHFAAENSTAQRPAEKRIVDAGVYSWDTLQDVELSEGDHEDRRGDDDEVAVALPPTEAAPPEHAPHPEAFAAPPRAMAVRSERHLEPSPKGRKYRKVSPQ